ncbi:putative E3 ubiquitin-protein ligase RBBP6 [Blattamonas nauphoetae]|uniref:E3 ubiquitin-protein ligase RBBP6 n=1 Tax=Blattamonas nauphoetae TaxID=2049346 RepID=A0ABQ9Y0Z0_9EUKA|nr:putative E3 ubiquitin-protein ligase RBBP6 [Blattamonas nauphoetae]
MESIIRYRFPNAPLNTITYESYLISGSDLKSKIIEQEKLNLSANELHLTDARTKAEYKNESKIPKNTTLTVTIHPVHQQRPAIPSVYDVNPRPSIVSKIDTNQAQVIASQRYQRGNQNEPKSLVDHLLNTNKHINSHIQQSFMQGNPSRPDPTQLPLHTDASQNRGRNNVPPPGYICKNCGKTDHYLQYCPLARVKGVPRDFLKASQTQDNLSELSERRFMADDGRTVEVVVHPTYVSNNLPAKPLAEPRIPSSVPEELRCPSCHALNKEAFVISCCNNVICKKCCQDHLSQKLAQPECPLCHKRAVPTSTPAYEIRRKVEDFLSGSLLDGTSYTPSASPVPSFPPPQPQQSIKLPSPQPVQPDYNRASDDLDNLDSMLYFPPQSQPQRVAFQDTLQKPLAGGPLLATPSAMKMSIQGQEVPQATPEPTPVQPPSNPYPQTAPQSQDFRPPIQPHLENPPFQQMPPYPQMRYPYPQQPMGPQYYPQQMYNQGPMMMPQYMMRPQMRPVDPREQRTVPPVATEVQTKDPRKPRSPSPKKSSSRNRRSRSKSSERKEKQDNSDKSERSSPKSKSSSSSSKRREQRRRSYSRSRSPHRSGRHSRSSSRRSRSPSRRTDRRSRSRSRSSSRRQRSKD